MANKQRGEHALKAGKATYTLVFNSNALAQAEDQLGHGLGRVMNNYMTGMFSMSETITLLWAALLKHHGPLSVDDAGDILDDLIAHYKDLGRVFNTLMDCVNDAIPFGDNGEEGDTPNRAEKVALRGNGSRQKAGDTSSGSPVEQDSNQTSSGT